MLPVNVTSRWRREDARAGAASTSTQGSVPREAGTWMAVFADGVVGTIGGGHLEFQAIARGARAALAGAPAATPVAALSARPEPGPVLRRRGAPALRARSARPTRPALRRAAGAQPARRWRCSAAATSARRWCGVLAPLPFAVHLDRQPRRDLPAARCRRNVHCEHSDPVQAAVARPGARLARADHELQPCRRPGHRGRLPASASASAATCPTSA